VQLVVYSVIRYLRSTILKLLLTPAAWDKALKGYLFELRLRINDSHLPHDLQVLAVLLYFGDELTDVLVGETETINLKWRIFNKETFIKQLWIA
jgi:hypothetical protein